MSVKQMTVEYDEETEALLDDLKKYFGVKSKSAVMKRALAIAKAAKTIAEDDKIIVVSSTSDPDSKKTILLGV